MLAETLLNIHFFAFLAIDLLLKAEPSVPEAKLITGSSGWASQPDLRKGRGHNKQTATTT